VTISVKKSQEALYNLDPGSFFKNRFWGRRPDWVAINEALQIVYILGFKQSTERDEGKEEEKKHHRCAVRSKLLLQSGNLSR